MAFISFEAEGRASYGIAQASGVYDLGARLGGVLPDLKSYLAAQGLGILGKAAGNSTVDFAEGEFTYLPVIPNPTKILCVGLNYEEHRAETGRAKTDHPAIFTRYVDTLIGHQANILMPPNSSSLDYEGELAVVIGKRGYRVSEANALDLVAGYSVFNDATLRDWQRHTIQFTPGKNFRGTGAFGPSLITPEEAGAIDVKAIRTTLNENVMQEARLGDMIFSVARVIEYLSGFTVLSPGDVIATGTPGGVGFKREPQLFMKPGDRVEVSVEGIGRLVNVIASEVQ